MPWRSDGSHSSGTATVLVVGGGVVGSSFAKALSSRGMPVQIIEPNTCRRQALRTEGLDAVAHATEVEPFDIAFLCVPTPSTCDGYDLSFVQHAAQDLAEWLSASPGAAPIVAVRSTVPPGTTDTVLAPIFAGTGVHVAAVPEYLREASAEQDAASPRVQVIGASDRQVRAALVALLEQLGGEIVEFDNPAGAELAKVAHNAFNATKISFFNELHDLACNAGVDAGRIAETVIQTAEAAWNPRYGIVGGSPFSGSCLPKDLDGLLAYGAQREHALPLLRAVREVNRNLEIRTVQP